MAGLVTSGKRMFGLVTSGKRMFCPVTSVCSFGFGGTVGFTAAGFNDDGKKLPVRPLSIEWAGDILSLLMLMIPAEW